jgi:hypothetical protein
MPISTQQRRVPRSGIVVAALVSVLAIPPASAATQCIDGPATEASPARPHLVDAAASEPVAENLPSPTGVSDISDIRAAWVAAVLRPDLTLDFSIAVNLAGVPDTPGSYVHVNVVGDDDDNYLAYRSPSPLATPSWHIVRSWTELDLGTAGGRTVMNVADAAAGSVTEDGVVTFDIPDAELGGLSQVRLEVETGTLQPSQVNPGQLHGVVRHDATQQSCTATLA